MNSAELKTIVDKIKIEAPAKKQVVDGCIIDVVSRGRIKLIRIIEPLDKALKK